MKLNGRFFTVFALSFIALTFFAAGNNAMAAKSLVVADFDTGDKPNNIGGDFGAWDKDPNDESQGTQLAFEPDDALGDPAGYSIRLDYDVDSPNPAYNGFWMKLNGEDASKFNTINFYLRGEVSTGFTKRVKIELKDMSNRPSPYIVTGVTEQWQKFSIPFEKFRRVNDWASMNEFVVVFDDINSNPKAGTVFIDHISFSSE
ncbi:MAG: carbohydrate binding domain-containing protein [Candidatus Omnitrophota bacterium]|nr:carbohydrate binding domain-containing protein [Candidatus Omnitrophota bacterium]